MKKKTTGKKTLLAEDKRRMQRLAGIIKESMFFEADDEEEVPVDAPPAPEDDMGGETDLGGAPDMGGEPDLGGDMDSGAPVDGVEDPNVEEMVNLFRDFLVAQQESGRIGLSADGAESVPAADFDSEPDMSSDVPEPDEGEGMESEDEPELQKEKYNKLEEELFESVMRRVRKEMIRRKPTSKKK